MLVLQTVRWLLLLIEIWIAGPILYLCVLSISAIQSRKKRKVEDADIPSRSEAATINFAVLIPAHNEEVLLGALLESLAALVYSKDHYTVYVVADNCTDNTAGLARAV